MLRFEKPAAAQKAGILAFAQSFYDAGETVINGSAGLDFYESFEEWLAYLGRIERGEEEGFVPSHVWLAYNEANALVGILDIRPALPAEKWHFGHIGYAVAPGHRRKGYAQQMLRWGTEQLQKAGLGEVLAACYEGNKPSRHTLEKGGYIPKSTYPEPETGKNVLVYHKMSV